MSLSSQVNSLATRVGQEIKAVRGEKVTNLGGFTGGQIITQAAYDALGTPDSETLYLIVG